MAAKQARPSGWATIRFEFACDGGGIGNVRTELTDEETADRHEEEPAHKLAALKKPRAG